MLASKRKGLPSTFSPTRNPITANIDTWPCANSASRYLLKVVSVSFSASPRGSNNPTESMPPGNPSADAGRADWMLLTGAGLKAEADVARVERYEEH